MNRYTESQGLADALRMLAARKGRATIRDAPQDVSTFPATKASREAERLDRSTVRPPMLDAEGKQV